MLNRQALGTQEETNQTTYKKKSRPKYLSTKEKKNKSMAYKIKKNPKERIDRKETYKKNKNKSKF
jgi:hypothetical protein